jgi:hypothetical protein
MVCPNPPPPTHTHHKHHNSPLQSQPPPPPLVPSSLISEVYNNATEFAASYPNCKISPYTRTSHCSQQSLRNNGACAKSRKTVTRRMRHTHHHNTAWDDQHPKQSIISACLTSGHVPNCLAPGCPGEGGGPLD